MIKSNPSPVPITFTLRLYSIGIDSTGRTVLSSFICTNTVISSILLGSKLLGLLSSSLPHLNHMNSLSGAFLYLNVSVIFSPGLKTYRSLDGETTTSALSKFKFWIFLQKKLDVVVPEILNRNQLMLFWKYILWENSEIFPSNIEADFFSRKLKTLVIFGNVSFVRQFKVQRLFVQYIPVFQLKLQENTEQKELQLQTFSRSSRLWRNLLSFQKNQIKGRTSINLVFTFLTYFTRIIMASEYTLITFWDY